MTKIIDLQAKFSQEIAPKLKEELGLKNAMAVPKVTKITINSGLGPHIQKGNKNYEYVVENLGKISGQKPMLNKAKKSVSNFKIREGEVVGTSVTLRGKRMYYFLTKLINVVFPRVRDF
ncbi:50S ribosomal protein L5, partial [Candidatus Peregrinibacteria bacterium]|nr:50S ribosomal protein L5 [Candidatus Peregrinibacteria bacterium]